MLSLTGRRIRLRDFQPNDLAAYHKWESDAEVMALATWRAHSVHESEMHLADAIEQSLREDRQRYFLAVESIESGLVFGSAGFTIKAKNDSGGIAEIGYFLLKEYWGKGYGTEAARLVIDYVFDRLHMHKIVVACNADNHASENIMIKCGMSKEGEFPKGRLKQGRWCNALQYGLLSEQWKQQQS
jgi:RimJ/RimL family protein N-acetyltransferase